MTHTHAVHHDVSVWHPAIPRLFVTCRCEPIHGAIVNLTVDLKRSHPAFAGVTPLLETANERGRLQDKVRRMLREAGKIR